jgi:glycosyltransferase involved in cell wall biosynthesis
VESELLPSAPNAYRVTAVVSAWRCESFLAQRLHNLCAQRLCGRGALEIVVVDSASDQAERSIALDFRKRCPHIAYVRTAGRESVYGAWNRGIRLAKGAYFINANADDRFAPDALERLAGVLDTDPGIDAAYGDWLCTNTPNDRWDGGGAKGLFEYPAWYPPLLFYLQLTSHAAMIRRTVFDRIGPFDEHMEVFGDREFMYRFAAAGHRAVKIDEPVGLYYENPHSVVRRRADIADKENVALTRRYFAPERLARLWGEECGADGRRLGRLYALTGALGINRAAFDGMIRSFSALARSFLDRALELDPGNVTALGNMAVLDCSVGHSIEGVARLERALTLADTAHRPAIEHLLALTRRAITSSAALCPFGLPFDPGRLRFEQIDRPVGISVMAIRRFEAGRMDEAIDLCRRIIASNPRAAHARTLLGRALWQRGEHAEALHHFTRSLSVCPTSRRAVLACGTALTHSGRTDEARRLYEAFSRARPGDPEIEARLRQNPAIGRSSRS